MITHNDAQSVTISGNDLGILEIVCRYAGSGLNTKGYDSLVRAAKRFEKLFDEAHLAYCYADNARHDCLRSIEEAAGFKKYTL